MDKYLLLNEISDTDLCIRFRTFEDRARGAIAEVLLSRHDRLIRRLARQAASHRDFPGTFDDALQSARLAALESYATFDPSHGAALSTYVFYGVTRYLSRCKCEEQLIRIPQRKFKARAYALGGEIDGTFRQDIENEYELHTSEDRANFVAKHQILANQFEDLSTNNEPIAGSMEEQLSDSMVIATAIESLSQIQRRILALICWDELDYNSAADKLGITYAQLRHQLMLVRRQLQALLD